MDFVQNFCLNYVTFETAEILREFFFGGGGFCKDINKYE